MPVKGIIKKTRIYFSEDKILYRSLKNVLGFYPTNIALYKQAFRHRSAIKEKTESSNERLEFLGDAVISAVIGHYLFQRFPFKDEGFLTKMRSKIVSRAQLNGVANKLGLPTFIQTSADASIKNSSAAGDALEALIGAVYLDKGFKKATSFIIERIIKNHIDIDEVETKEIDFKSKVIEWAQKEKVPFEFKLIEEIKTGIDKKYVIELLLNKEVKGKGVHFSKKRAEQMAAEAAAEFIK